MTRVSPPALLCTCISCNNNLTGKHINSHSFRVPGQNNKLAAISHICGLAQFNLRCTAEGVDGRVGLLLHHCKWALYVFRSGPHHQDKDDPVSASVGQQSPKSFSRKPENSRALIKSKSAPRPLTLSPCPPPTPSSSAPARCAQLTGTWPVLAVWRWSV